MDDLGYKIMSLIVSRLCYYLYYIIIVYCYTYQCDHMYGPSVSTTCQTSLLLAQK